MLRGQTLGVGLAVALLTAASFNTPLPTVVAQTVGLQQGDSHSLATQPVPCNADGVGLLKYDTILRSPQEFDVGARGFLNPFGLSMAHSMLVHPIWYVVSDTEPTSGEACPPARLGDVLVGYNPDTHLMLHAFGRLSPGN